MDRVRVRIRDDAGAFRVLYVAKFDEAIYVLHCFHKKAQQTRRGDKEIAEVRYRAVARARKPSK